MALPTPAEALGVPMSKAKPATESCFVIMPFGGHWDTYYNEVYKPAILQAGIRPVRADEAFSAGSVLKDIVEFLLQCRVVLADITEPNRNVHYELGLAHALGKPTVLVAPQEMEIFFDIRQERVINYSTNKNPNWGRDLAAAVSAAVKETVANPQTAIPSAFLHVKPSRLEVDETALRLRRIEDVLAALSRAIVTSVDGEPSRLRFLLKGLPAAEEEAERLLAKYDRQAAIRSLREAGYGEFMASADHNG